MIIFEKLRQVKEMITYGCLIGCNYFTNYYQMIAIDLSKQQAVDVDPKAMQQINFAGNLDREEG